MILVYITFPNQKEAKKVAQRLLRKRIAACANIFPISSFYWWRGKIVNEKEFALILKTEDRNFNQIKEMVKKLHRYEKPCILGLKIDKINKEYLNWLKGEIR